MVVHTLKILQYLLQDFKSVYDHFLDTRHYRVNSWKYGIVEIVQI